MHKIENRNRQGTNHKMMKPQGAKMTKKARERKREEEKAEKALGGGTMVEVQGEESTKKQHWHVELQWFRLLRGEKRLNQIARILVELAPTNIFDPRDIWNQQMKIEASAESEKAKDDDADADAKTKSKDKDKPKKLSKKDQIIANNNAKRQQEFAARDAEKLRTLGAKAAANIKLKTDNGKLMLLLQILKSAVAEKNVVDTLDTMWEIEDIIKEMDPKEVKASFKPFSEVLKLATDIRNDRKNLGGMNIYDFQLSSMSDRLPPLSLHTLQGKFRLDPWQIKVIKLVNAKKSVLVTAPTSSGKTVLSTYVCTSGGKVLFVVPTEPLAWQVAAMLGALKLNVALAVPTLNYVPQVYDVVVGTPHAVESTLTKRIGFDFDYAVFDEVHSLNSSDGAALQRLIRAIPESASVMALSATIGNAPELVRWWETIVGEGGIELVDHKSRFINLQRHVWVNGEAQGETASEDDGLHLLHPASSLSVEYLSSNSFESSDIAFAPSDTFKLYKHMSAICDLLSDVNTDNLQPKKFFAKLASNTGRITLMQAKQYEDALKAKLVEIAKSKPASASLILASLAPGVDVKELKNKRKEALEGKGEEEIAKYDSDTAAGLRKSMEGLLQIAETSVTAESLYQLSKSLREKDMLPGICFQLDSVRCQSFFDGLLRCLEEDEKRVHPNYRKDLLRKSKGLEKAMEKAMKREKNKGDKGGDKERVDSSGLAADMQEFNEVSGPVDLDAPHQDFVLSPPGKGMGSTEAKDVQFKLSSDLPSNGDLAHPLIRGLRRGIGMYIEGLPSSYHRVVQSFAQQGRLGVVLSDELLAYGVNMPFRSCIFYGDSGEDWLTPLLHQQMAGRAGRRGLDRQGHLIYAGFSPLRLRHLMRGQLPDVTGEYPLYVTVPLQLEMNRRWESTGTKLSEEKMRIICATPLAEYLKGEEVSDYYDVAKQWIDHLGILNHPRSTYSYLIPELIWELRNHVAESLALEYVLEPMIQKFKEAVSRMSDSEKESDVVLQTRLYLLFCRICAREEYVPLEGGSPEETQSDALKYFGSLPAPHLVDENWDEWTVILNESQQRIADCNLPHKEHMFLPVAMDKPLDNLCYSSFVRNQIDPSLPTPLQHRLRQRIWNIGEVLRICSNVLGKSSELDAVQNLIRKAFVRIRYILDETSQRNWKQLDSASMAYQDDL